MKKIHVIVQKKDIVPALGILREMGVVHVEHQEELSGFQLEERREEVEVLKQALDILQRVGCASGVAQQDVKDWTDTVNEILELWAEAGHYQESIARRGNQIRQWEPWGDFDPRDVEELARHGIYVQLCEVPVKGKIDVPPGVILEEVSVSAGVRRCLAVARGKVSLPLPTVTPPPSSLHQMRDLQKEEEARTRQAREKIEGLRCHEDAFRRILVERENVLRFEEVQKGMREEQALALVKGYCPAEVCGQMQERAKQEQWGLLIEAPSDSDNPPTLLKNPSWIEWIKPVFAFMNILPGYRELDVSFLFLFFLSVFFGILIGDAGYGFMFIALTFLAQWKLGAKISNHSYFYLVYVLSSFAVLWGILTGTVFGTLLFKSFIKPTVPWLTNNSNVQFFCFTLGAIHLTIAHIWRAMNRLNSVTAFAEVGWMAVIWASYFFINKLVLSRPLPGFMNILLVGGPALVILFNQPRKNILAGIGLGLGDFLLSVMGFFGDVISYIRLFAVGLAGVAVADTTNQMALSLGFNHVVAGFFAALILVAGHLLNMVLSCFAILVHGIRLNILEFSMHLGVEWAGVPYEPFVAKQYTGKGD